MTGHNEVVFMVGIRPGKKVSLGDALLKTFWEFH